MEMINYAFFQCDEVYRVWRALARWWNREIGSIDSVYALLESCEEVGESVDQPKLWKETV